MNHQDMIDVIQAHKEGKSIEYSVRRLNAKWNPVSGDGAPCWDFNNYDYRAKPEPLEVWVNVYDGARRIHRTKEDAKAMASNDALRVAVHMREVV